MRTSVCLAVLAVLAVAVSGQATLEWTGIPVPTGADMVNIFVRTRSLWYLMSTTQSSCSVQILHGNDLAQLRYENAQHMTTLE